MFNVGHNLCSQGQHSVMWSETVGLRTRSVSDQKKSVFVLVLQVWCCVVKHDHVTLIVIMIFKETATFQVLFTVSVLGTSLLWRSTVGFTYLKVTSAECLSLIPMVLVLVLVLRFWSCLHHWSA